jgi:hypothetical protein
MTTYTFHAMDPSGQEVKDEVDAVSQEEAIFNSRGEGDFPTKVREKATKEPFRRTCKRLLPCLANPGSFGPAPESYNPYSTANSPPPHS